MIVSGPLRVGSWCEPERGGVGVQGLAGLDVTVVAMPQAHWQGTPVTWFAARQRTRTHRHPGPRSPTGPKPPTYGADLDGVAGSGPEARTPRPGGPGRGVPYLSRCSSARWPREPLQGDVAVRAACGSGLGDGLRDG